jgi:hypothetical protein
MDDLHSGVTLSAGNSSIKIRQPYRQNAPSAIDHQHFLFRNPTGNLFHLRAF